MVDGHSKNLNDYHCYIGFTSRLTFAERYAEHSTLHAKLESEVLKTYESLANVCYAECVGIEHVRKLVEQKSILSCWNKSSGYDVGTHNACGSSKTFILYMLWTKKLNDRDNLIGSITRKRNEEKRQPGQFWSLNCSQNLNFRSGNIERYFYKLDRVNYECFDCKLKFKSNVSLAHHVEAQHNASEEVFDCKLCKYSGFIHDIRKHRVKP